MAKRFCDTGIWDKAWFMSLSVKHKCLIRFIFDKCDVAGVWEPNWALTSLYIGETCNELDLNYFDGHIKKLPGNKIFVIDFIYFQYGTLSEKSNPHQKVISILKKYNLYNSYLKGTLRGNSGAKEEDKEEEEDMDEDKEEERGLQQKLDDMEESFTLKETYMKNHKYTEAEYYEMFSDFRKVCMEKEKDDMTLMDLKNYLSNFNRTWKQNKIKDNGKSKSEQRDANTNDLRALNQLAGERLNSSINFEG